MGRYADHALAEAALRVLALDADDLISPSTFDDDEYLPLSSASELRVPDDSSTAEPPVRKQAERLLGCLLLAAEDTAGALSHDLQQLQAGCPAHDDDRITVLWQLPPQFLARYDAAFVERFLDSFLELGRRLTSFPWDPPSCVAQELGLRLLFDRVDLIANLHHVDLAGGWRETVEDLLFLDTDHEYLYDPEHDGFEDNPELLARLRMAPMHLGAWFDPFQKHPST